jgi:hypothetical protein
MNDKTSSYISFEDAAHQSNRVPQSNMFHRHSREQQCFYFEIAFTKSFISFPILSNKLQSFADPDHFLTERESYLVQTINEIADISEFTE